MKIRKIDLKKSKLLKLNFINTKLYRKLHINFTNVNDIIIRLKQSLQIIYKYHTNNKRILFIGFSNELNNKFKHLLKNTNHILLPNFIWPNGILTNKNASLNYILKNQTSMNHQLSNTLFKFNKKIDLIVLLDSFSEKDILKESYNARIPLISLTDSLSILNVKPTYKIIGNLNFSRKSNKNNFFYLILNSLFKKSKKIKLLNKPNNSVENIKVKNFYKFKNKIKNPKFY